MIALLGGRVFRKNRAAWSFVVLLFYLLMVLAGPAAAAAAPTFQRVETGVEYAAGEKVLGDGNRAAVYCLRVDLKAHGVELKPVLAGDKLGNLEPLSKMVERYGAVGGVNGTFYIMGSPRLPVDTMVIDNNLLVRGDREATALVISEEGQAFFERLNPRVTLRLPGRKVIFEVDTVNRPTENGLTIFTSAYGDYTGSGSEALEIPAIPDRAGRLVLGEAVNGNAPIPAGGLVISLRGEKIKLKEYFTPGQVVIMEVEKLGMEDVKHLIANGPLLVQKGCKYVPIPTEGLDSALWARHPRTAVGITEAGKVLLVVVDGRRADSVGMTFDELAELMLELGAEEAMALDGGGSSEMIVAKKIVNVPSDGVERRINNALLVISQLPIYVNGKRIYFDVSPQNENGRILAPMRQLFETLGAQVEWNEEKRTVYVTRGKTKIELPVGKKTARVNGKTVTLDVPARIVEGRTLVPVRFVSQALGAKVKWDSMRQAVVISY